MPIMRLLYVSQATAAMSSSDLIKLMDQCADKNSHRDVTGMLLYSAGNFLQVLEGPGPTLESLYGTISKDARHQTVERLIFQEAPDRFFANWHMGLLNLDTMAPLDRAPLLAFAKGVQQGTTPRRRAFGTT